jgi:hypothetical protein
MGRLIEPRDRAPCRGAWMTRVPSAAVTPARARSTSADPKPLTALSAVVPELKERRCSMAKVTVADRNRLPFSAFAFPKTRTFPIHDRAHARDALARASHAGPATLAVVRAAFFLEIPRPSLSGVWHAE